MAAVATRKTSGRRRKGLTLDATAFRPTARVREIIDNGPDGMTVSGRINYHIERSAEVEERLVSECRRAFGGETAYGFGYLVARLLAGLEHESQRPLLADSGSREQIAGLFCAMAELIKGKPADDDLVGTDKKHPEKRAIFQVKSADRTEPYEKVLERAAKQLSQHAERLYWPLADASQPTAPPGLLPTAEDVKRLFLAMRPTDASAQEGP